MLSYCFKPSSSVIRVGANHFYCRFISQCLFLESNMLFVIPYYVGFQLYSEIRIYLCNELVKGFCLQIISYKSQQDIFLLAVWASVLHFFCWCFYWRFFCECVSQLLHLLGVFLSNIFHKMNVYLYGETNKSWSFLFHELVLDQSKPNDVLYLLTNDDVYNKSVFCVIYVL